MHTIFQTLPCLIFGHLYLFSDIFKSLAEVPPGSFFVNKRECLGTAGTSISLDFTNKLRDAFTHGTFLLGVNVVIVPEVVCWDNVDA